MSTDPQRPIGRETDSDAQAFVAGGLFIVGEGEELDEVQSGEAWIATADAVEVRP